MELLKVFLIGEEYCGLVGLIDDQAIFPLISSELAFDIQPLQGNSLPLRLA